MNNKDEVEYLNKARARAEYLATAKKRMETMPVDELLMLVKKGSGEIAMLAGDEITRRIESAQQCVNQTAIHAADCAINVGMLGECDCGAE